MVIFTGLHDVFLQLRWDPLYCANIFKDNDNPVEKTSESLLEVLLVLILNTWGMAILSKIIALYGIMIKASILNNFDLNVGVGYNC